MAVPTCTHTLVHLHACDHVAPVQPATSRSAGEGVPNYGFLLLRQTSRHFFHMLPSPSTAHTPILVFFWRSTHFLGFSTSKIAKTLPGSDATFVLCLFSFQPCVGAYVGRAHMYAHFGAIACMRSCRPSATSSVSICRRGVSQLCFFATPSNGPKLFPHVGITIHNIHANLHIFPTLDAFPRIFQAKTP